MSEARRPHNKKDIDEQFTTKKGITARKYR